MICSHYIHTRGYPSDPHFMHTLFASLLLLLTLGSSIILPAVSPAPSAPPPLILPLSPLGASPHTPQQPDPTSPPPLLPLPPQVQQLGRTHRSNQAQPPRYLLVCTDISGESRFASAVAMKLEQVQSPPPPAVHTSPFPQAGAETLQPSHISWSRYRPPSPTQHVLPPASSSLVPPPHSCFPAPPLRRRLC